MRTTLEKTTPILLTLFGLSSLVALLVVATVQFPIYVRGLEFHIDIPDEEFSADDFDSAIETLESHNFTAEVDNQIPWYCNYSLKVSPSENPRLRAYLGTDCDSSVWGSVFVFGKLEYPAHNPFELGHNRWTPMVDEKMGQVLALLEMTPTSSNIGYDEDDFGIATALLQFMALDMAFAQPVALGLASMSGTVARRRYRLKEDRQAVQKN